MDEVLHWFRDEAAPFLAPRVSAHETRGFGMPDGQLLEFSGVTKRFGAVMAVSGLTARIEPGLVTGFLGPNGAGKTTTLRILLGLVRATDGTATIGGKRYADLATPLQTVGAVLEASSFHPGRTAANHLTIYAQAAGISKARVDEALGLVGLGDAAGRKVGGFSLGMRQRLGLAYALLGDPGVLVLDEPANGLDPEGIRWMRGFLRQLAAEGRTVLVSSHLLSEVQQTVDALLIISRGRLVFQGSIDDLADPSEHATIVDAPDRAALGAALQAAGVPFEVLRSGLTVRGLEPAAVGAVAAGAGVALSSLHRRGPALEEVFLDLVNGARVHASAAGAVGGMAAVGSAESDGSAAEESVTTEPDAAAEPEGPEPEAAAEPEAPEPEAAGPVTDEPVAAAPEAPEPEAADLSAADPEAPEPEAAGPVTADPEASEPTAAEPLTADPEAPEPEAAEPVAAAPEAAAPEAAAPDATEPEPAEPEPAGVEPATAEQTELSGSDALAALFADAEPQIAEPAESDAGAEPGAQPLEPPADAGGEASVAPAPDASAAYAVAGSGVIDIVPTPAEQATDEDPWAPADADPDGEAIGETDDELSEPVDVDDERPWENFSKTDADVEADAFFAAFDTGPVPEVPSDPEPDSDTGEPGASSEPGDHEGGDR